MHQTWVLIFLLGVALSEEQDTFSSLDRIIISSNCSHLLRVKSKLLLSSPVKLLSQENILKLSGKVQQRLQELNCPGQRKRRQNEGCAGESVGDGWCDVACNVKEKDWDGGDCCPHTCTTRERTYPCGSGGYQCKGARKIPVWFASRTQLCYQWYADGDAGQCGGGAGQHLCAGVNELTAPYRDDTDGRPGGCRMSWGLITTDANVPEWFKNVNLCYRWHPDGDGGQCGGGAPRETCAPLGSYTAVYRDDTDHRGGGCQMSWRLTIPAGADYWAQDMSICFKWWPDGDGGQCGGGAERLLCAVANLWTPYYRDDTDKRGGGCRMQWGIFLV